MTKGMSTTGVAMTVLRAERAGHEYVTLVCYRARAPRTTVALLPGVSGRVVGTELDAGRVKVIAQARVADLRRWYERTCAKLPDDMPDDLLHA